MSGWGIVSGRLASFRLGATGIDYIGKWTLNITNETVGAVYFGSYWAANAPVGMSWSGSVEGYYDASTGSGSQITLWSNLLSGVKVNDCKFFVGGSTTGNFYMPGCSTDCISTGSTDSGAYFGNFKHSVGAKELGTVTFDVYGYKALVMCSGTSTAIIAQSTG